VAGVVSAPSCVGVGRVPYKYVMGERRPAEAKKWQIVKPVEAVAWLSSVTVPARTLPPTFNGATPRVDVNSLWWRPLGSTSWIIEVLLDAFRTKHQYACRA